VPLQEPASGSTTNSTPTFGGETNDVLDPVKVLVYEGKVAEGQPLLTLQGFPSPGGSWREQVPTVERLAGGTYTAVAEQTESLPGGEPPGITLPVSFQVNTEPPEVTLNQPAPLSNNQKPSFSGTASEAGEVVVHILEAGQPVATATATTSGGSWSSNAASPELPKGKRSFTAYATEQSALGNADGQSTPPVNFQVNTEPPEVVVKSPPLVSSETTPAFSGTASESKPVTVKLYAGTTAVGMPVREPPPAQVTSGRWSSTPVAALEDGKYTVVASEPSSLENPTGSSTPVTFEINTSAPNVTLAQPTTPSNVTTPSFKGTVSGPESEKKPVTVFIHAGQTPDGPTVAEIANVPVNKAGGWVSGPVELPSGNHVYTAVATTPSAIGNATGASAPATFVIDTEAPVVTLNQPTTPSNTTEPSFSGKTSESSPITVSIYQGSAVAGGPVRTVKAKKESVGSWESVPALPPLPDGRYTAIATQPSALAGNPSGSSQAVSFTIDTQKPVVTLNTLPSPSPNRAPSFSGTANESNPVMVKTYHGATLAGNPLTVQAEVSSGVWVAGRLEEPLDFGEYSAVAEQESSIGNGIGRSNEPSNKPMTFVVAQIAPTAETEASSDVTRSSAALYASVNPHAGSVSDCHFEYGPTTSYGSQVECGFVAELAAFPAASTGAVAVFARVYGLHPSTTYHVRIVAVGEGGSGAGADSTFTTLAPIAFPPPGGPSTPAGSAPVAKAAVGGVAALFAEQLIPKGPGARIGALLKSGMFKQRFKAPEAGTAVVKWFYLPPRAKGARRPPVLVASGKVVFPAAGSATLKIRLTPAGRRLLRRSRRVRLKATCRFTPAGGTAVSVSGPFTLHR
jgi:hypothetical protein